jgi:hypothetical protein
METDGKDLPGNNLGDARLATRSTRRQPGGAWPRRAIDMAERDFLYQRRLVSFRPFVADDGVPGLNLRFEGDDMIAMRIEGPLLDILHQAIGRLKESPGIKR